MSNRDIDIERVRMQVKEISKKLGSKRRRFPNSLRVDVLALVESGMGIGEISRSTGVAHSSIRGWIKGAQEQKQEANHSYRSQESLHQESLSPTIMSVVPDSSDSLQDCSHYLDSCDDLRARRSESRFGFSIIAGQRSVEFLFLVRRC